MLRKIILVALAAVVTHSFGAAQAPQAAAKTVVAAVKNDGKPLYVAGPVSDELKQKCTKTVTWNADDTAWLRTDFMASPSFTLVEESTRPAVKQIRGFLDAVAVMHFTCVFLDTKEHFYVSVTPQKTVDGQKAFPAVVVHGASKTEPVDFMVFLETVVTKQTGGSWLSSILKGIGAVGTAIAGKVFLLDPFLSKRRADADAKAAAEKARLAEEKRKAEVCAEIKTLEAELGQGPFETKDKDLKTLEAERDRLKLLKEARDKAEVERLAAEKRKAEQLAAFNTAKTVARSRELTICGQREKAIEIQGIQGGWIYLTTEKISMLDGTTDANRLCTYLIHTISPIKLKTNAEAKSDLAKALEGDKTAFAAARKALQFNLDYLDPKSSAKRTLYGDWSGHPDNICGVLRQDLEAYIQFHRNLLAELDRLTQEAEGEALRVAALLEQIRALEAERGRDKFDATGKTAEQCEEELARLKQAKPRPAPRVPAYTYTPAAGTVADDVPVAYAPSDGARLAFKFYKQGSYGGFIDDKNPSQEHKDSILNNLVAPDLLNILDPRLRSAVSAYDMRGNRHYAEDNMHGSAEDAVDAYQLGEWLGFAVYDGHAGYQTACALAGMKKGPKDVLEFDSDAQETRLLPALIDVVKAHGVDRDKIDALYLAIDKKLEAVASGSGSTAVVMLINLQTKEVHFINLGDSRAVAVNAAGGVVTATVDHDPKCGGDVLGCAPASHVSGCEALTWGWRGPRSCNKASEGCIKEVHGEGCEVKRIMDEGGTASGGRIGGTGLSVARSFGDFGYKPEANGVRRHVIGIVPEITTFNLADAARIVLACDGVWDVVLNAAATEAEGRREAVGTILQRAVEGNFNPAEYLCKSAMVAGSFDNISAIVIDVQRILAALTPVPRVDASGSAGSVTGDVDPGRGATGSGMGDRGLRTAALLASLRGMVTEAASCPEGFYNSDGTINFQHAAFDEIRQQILGEIERDMCFLNTVPLYKMQCSVCHKQGEFKASAEPWCADCKKNTRVICEEIAPSAWQDISDEQIVRLIKHPRNVTLETVPQVQSKFNSAADVINEIGSKFAVANAEFTKMVALADKAQEAGKIHDLLSARQGVETGILKTGYLSDSVVEFNAKYASECGIAPCPGDQCARFGLVGAESAESLPGLLVCCAHRSLMAGPKFNGNKEFYKVHDSFGVNIFPMPMVEAEDIDGLQEDFLKKAGVIQALDTAVAETLLAGKRVVFACNSGQNRSAGMMYFYLKRLLGNAVSWYKLTSWVHFSRNDCFDVLGAFMPALNDNCPKTKLLQQGLLRYVMADDFKKRGLLPADFTYEMAYQWPLDFGGASIDAAGSFLDDVDDEDVPEVTSPGGSRRGGAVSSYTPPAEVVAGLKAQVEAFKFPTTVRQYSDAELAAMINTRKVGELPNNDPRIPDGLFETFEKSGNFNDVDSKFRKAFVDVLLSKQLPFHKVVDGLYLGDNQVTKALVRGSVSSLKEINDMNKEAWGPDSYLLSESALRSSLHKNPEAMLEMPGLIVVVAEEHCYAGKLTKAEDLEIDLRNALLPQLQALGSSKYLYCPCKEDGSDTFKNEFEGKYQNLIFRAIDEALESGKVVLVHCSNGAHRSASVVLWYLKARTQAPFWWLNALLRARRPQVLDVRDLFIADAARKGNMMKAALYRSCGIDEVA